MPEVEPTNIGFWITLGIAIWGAVLATITFGWNLYRDLSDRGRLKVVCAPGKVVIRGVGVEDELTEAKFVIHNR